MINRGGRKIGFGGSLAGRLRSEMKNSNQRNPKNGLLNKQKPKSLKSTPIWRMKPPEDKDKFEWKEKAYRKYLEHI